MVALSNYGDSGGKEVRNGLNMHSEGHLWVKYVEGEE